MSPTPNLATNRAREARFVPSAPEDFATHRSATTTPRQLNVTTGQMIAIFGIVGFIGVGIMVSNIANVIRPRQPWYVEIAREWAGLPRSRY